LMETDFRLPLEVEPSLQKINHQDKILLMGSCFTEHMAEHLARLKFNVLDNPHGILFNPVSIAQALFSYIENRRYRLDDLFFQNECWNSWDHHSRFSDPEKEKALERINKSVSQAHTYLQQADWLVLTLGSAFVYELPQGKVVANCHKVPTDKFKKRLLTIEDILSVLDNVMHRLFFFNPKIRVIFTVSPVRHSRDGYIANNRSKATLLHGVHHLVDKFDRLHYFPAYELVIDDLRDYRFFAEDMVHPNYLATRYVWDHFRKSFVNPELFSLLDELQKLNQAKNHRSMHPTSVAHRNFLLSQKLKAKNLVERFPYLDLSSELQHFQI
jgi:GSCFA family